MNNPVKELRETLRLSRKSFCILYNVPLSTLANSESGNIYKLPGNLLEGFRKAGVPEELIAPLSDIYKSWMLEIAEAELKNKQTIF